MAKRSKRTTRTKKTYSKREKGRILFIISEALITLGLYLGVYALFRRYDFYYDLSEYEIFVFLLLSVIAITFVFFVFTLLTGKYTNDKNKIYNGYIKKVNTLKRRGNYCPRSKYIISLIIGYSFFIFALGISVKKALHSDNEIFVLTAILLLLGLIGFSKFVLNGSLYALLSKKRAVESKEINPVEDAVSIPDKKN